MATRGHLLRLLGGLCELVSGLFLPFRLDFLLFG